MIVELHAVDWGTYLDAQMTPDTEWAFVKASIVGFLVDEDADKVVLAMQQFDDGGLRGVLVVPKVCIKSRHDFGEVA